MNTLVPTQWRKSTQKLLPSHYQPTPAGQYNLYPGFPLAHGMIETGFPKLASRLIQQDRVIIDGYVGVFWEHFREQMESEFQQYNITVTWINITDAMLSEEEIYDRIEPYLGGDDPVFGTRYTGALLDYFDGDHLHSLRPDSEADLTVLYGCGAALVDWEAFLVYLDLPKNELQYRSRAGSVSNLGFSEPADPKSMYKQFYFVDWVVLNRHKSTLVGDLDLIVDAQRPDHPTTLRGEDFRSTLNTMSRNYFRVRPWFEPGAWGGQWCKRRIPQLPEDVPNYAWSFELIVPENGLLFIANQHLLEVSFDWLMFYDHEAVLGEAASLFRYEFPIRFDFLDTVEGGNLSVQCHPQQRYIQKHFGESFTQTETYYILDNEPGANVYLGFQKNVDPEEFRRQLEQSAEEGIPVDINRYVQSFHTRKHGLYLHPSGTIHSSGAGNLVLEISSTPYIFTFKMYDWLRVDLDGNPRPLNIARAFENLIFDRQGNRIPEEFISKPQVLDEYDSGRVVHLPTHPTQFYDVHRYEFTGEISGATDGQCHVMNLVEGQSVILETAQGLWQRFNYAETFVVPAAAGEYRLINEGEGEAMVVKAFVKRGWQFDS